MNNLRVYLGSVFRQSGGRRTPRVRLHSLGPILLAGLCAVALVGCAALSQILGSSADKVQCSITGTVVGADGKAPTRIDMKWVPNDTLDVSTDLITFKQSGDSFTISQLTVAEGESVTRVQGELFIGEVALPPMPRRYDETEVAIDLPKGACSKDLGRVTLPLD